MRRSEEWLLLEVVKVVEVVEVVCAVRWWRRSWGEVRLLRCGM